MLLGLGWAEWLTIMGLIGGLVLTFKVMARASVAYEEARKRRESQQAEQPEEPEQMEQMEQESRP